MYSLYISWNKEYDLGIPIIDEQHRAIVATINTYHYFISSGKAGIALKPTFITLEQYTKIHFMTEENILEQAQYPKIDSHKELHVNLVKKMGDIARKSMRERDFNTMLQFLKEWWLNHIRVKDVQYVPYLINSDQSL
jgi:hemerythrin